jgi:hypothetical protein
MGKKKAPALTLRQRLRQAASAKLDGMVEQIQEQATAVCGDTSLLGVDLMHLASSRQNKTLREHMISALANDAEAELERLYNNQMGVPGVGDD